MKILTLNMNVFNLDVDESFDRYYDSICPDMAFIQECRYNKINKSYNPQWAGNYEEPIDSRIHISVAVSKKDDIIMSKSPISEDECKYDYKCIFVECEGNRFAGVHLPLKNKKMKVNIRKYVLNSRIVVRKSFAVILMRVKIIVIKNI